MCSYTTLADEWVTTRKVHQCDWCGELIEKGTKARRRVGIFEGDFCEGRQHPECYAAMEDAPHDVVCEGWMAGDFPRGSNEAH